MNDPRIELEETLFIAALELPVDEREAFLRTHCEGDADLLKSVRMLLTLHSTEDDIESVVHDRLNEELHEVATGKGDQELVGAQLGPYHILECLGAGGTGVVYRARQDEPIRREVAIKAIKPGMDTREVLLRFAAERQTLALMDHPGIARVIDAGATDLGRPYFVMELVEGEPIHHFCRRHQLGLRARLELFREVCHAVEHAHRRGIIHRDLKPSNILIGGEADAPRCKVIDFGIAKAMAARAPEDGDLTRQSEFIGTPAYMSPEQAAGELDLDTRSDGYSLGAVLHTLLVGVPPLPDEVRTLNEIAQLHHRLRDGPASRPSAAFAQRDATAQAEHATTAGATSAAWSQALRGELDWIVQRCLDPDRERRYPTVGDLAEDLRRHLDDEPVAAVAPSRLYLFGKSLRRHRYAYLSTAIVAAALVAATIVSQTQARRALRAEQHAAAEAATSRAVVEFLRQDVLAQASPDAQPDRDMKIITALENAATHIEDGRFAGQPLVEADVRFTIAQSLHDLGAYETAHDHYDRAWQLRRDQLGADARPTLVAQEALLTNLLSLGRYDEAEAAMGADYLARLENVLGVDDTLVLEATGRVGLMRRLQSRFDEAFPLLRKAASRLEAKLGRLNPATLRALSELAACLGMTHQYVEAENLQKDLIARQTEVYGPEHPATLRTRQSLANNYNRQIRSDEALALYQDIYRIRRRVQGEHHPDTLGTLQNMGSAYSRQFRLDEAVDAFTRARAGYASTLGPDHPNTLLILFNLGNVLGDLNRRDEAVAVLRECIERASRTLGPDHYRTTDAMTVLAQNLGRLGRRDEAAAIFEKALTSRRAQFGERSPRVFVTALLYSELLNEMDRGAEAVPIMERTLAGSVEVNGRDSINTAYMAGQLMRAHLLTGNPTAAAEVGHRFLDELLARYPDRHIMALYQYWLARAEAGAGHPEIARQLVDAGTALYAAQEAKIPEADRAAFATARAAALEAIAKKSPAQ